MQASAATHSLRNLTGHLTRREFQQVLRPVRWTPLYLGVLKITIVQSACLLMPEFYPRTFQYLDLLGRILNSRGLGYAGVDARRHMLRITVMLGYQLNFFHDRETVLKFTSAVLIYLTVFVLHRAGETTIQSDLGEPTDKFTLSYDGHSRILYPKIAVIYAGAPLLTVVSPSRRHGNPNCQLVAYLLAVAQKYFENRPFLSVCEPCLVRLADGPTNHSAVYFARARVTREYLANVENGMANEMEDGLKVFVSDAFDLSTAADRVRYVGSLTSVYKRACDYEDLDGYMPPLGDISLA